MMKKYLLGFVLLIQVPIIGFSQDKGLKSFHLSDVKLLESPFKNAEQIAIRYIMEMNPDRLLHPYLREAGLKPKGESYGNWENTGLDGHTAGHYLTALSLMYASTGHQESLQRLNYMIDELEKVQEAHGNGYIGGVPGSKAMWKEIANGNIRADNFSLNGKWVPWYNIHKTYAGIRDAYLIGGNQKAKEMLLKYCDWAVDLVSGLSDAQIQQMLVTEHGGMNEIFADVAEISGNTKYLELARKFSHERVLAPLLEGQDKLTGMHANTQIPKVIGFKRVADIAGDDQWDNASKFFWETVVDNRSVAIGGNSVREHFHQVSDFTAMITDKEGPETCNTYNMLKLSKMLFESSRSIDFLEFYERGMYNHILSSQHPERGGFVYFTSMRPNHYRVYSQPEVNFWCCVGSGLENHVKYGELVWAHTDNELYLNLFVPSTLNWKEKGLTITQNTRFPEEEQTTLTVDKVSKGKFTLKLRYPTWVEEGALRVSINGKDTKVDAKPGSYVSIERKWKKGDKVVVKLPMKTKLEQMPDKSPYFAVIHGPLVLAAKTTEDDLKGLIADGSRMGHIAHGEYYPLQEAPMFVSSDRDFLSKLEQVQGEPLTFKAPSLIHPDKFDDLQLIPFYKVHDSRYVVYWQHATPQQLDSIRLKIQEEERAKMVMEAQTIDKVAPGEQQPESDHFFKAEQSESGVHMNRHWRHARGWFSYELNNRQKEPAFLRITYFGGDNGRTFDILVNDSKIATVKLDGSKGSQFYSVDYPIPEKIIKDAKDGVLVTKFQAHPGSIAGGLYGVRLMKAN